MAKLAQLVANHGQWAGTEVVDSAWIAEMTTPHAHVDELGFDFGYFWWLDEARHIRFMSGHGGQYAFLVPDQDLLVVFTAFPNTQDDYQLREGPAFGIVDRIIAACH